MHILSFKTFSQRILILNLGNIICTKLLLPDTFIQGNFNFPFPFPDADRVDPNLDQDPGGYQPVFVFEKVSGFWG